MEASTFNLKPHVKRKLRVDAAKRGPNMTQHLEDIVLSTIVLEDESLGLTPQPAEAEVEHG